MAKFSGWVGRQDGSGRTVDTEGVIQEHASKPSMDQFTPRDPNAPKGNFIKTPELQTRIGEGGQAEVFQGSRYAKVFAKGETGQVRQEYLHEQIQRKKDAERAKSEALGARMTAKQRIDAQNTELQMLQNVRAKVEQEFSDGKYTPEQMEQLEDQIATKERAILPQGIKKQPSPQETFEASIVRLPNGRVGQMDKSGMFKEIETGISMTEYAKVKSDAFDALSNVVTGQDADGNDIYKDPTAEEINTYASDTLAEYMRASGLITGAHSGQDEQGGGVQGQQGGQQVQQEEQFTRLPQKGRRQKAPADKRTITKHFKEELDALGLRASGPEIAELGTRLVTNAVQSGMSAEDAVAELKKAHRSARQRLGGIWVGGFNERKMLETAELAEFDVLKAKSEAQ